MKTPDINFFVNYLTTPKVERTKNSLTPINQGGKQEQGTGTFFGQIRAKFGPLAEKVTLTKTRKQTGIKKPEESLLVKENKVIEIFMDKVIDGKLDYAMQRNTYVGIGHENKYWRELRALMIALTYSQVDPEKMSEFQDKIESITHHDDIPFKHGTEEYEIGFEEVLHIFEKSYNFFSGFGHLALATRRDGISEKSMFERFLNKINGENSFTVMNPQNVNGTINDFPGPGFIIKGIHSKINRQSEASQWNAWDMEHAHNPRHKVLSRYIRCVTEGEKYLSDTTFYLFRGVQVIMNPLMKVDNKEHALVIFNDHFHNEESGRMAYLIPVTNRKTKAFLRNPFHELNKNNVLYPASIEECFGGRIIRLNTISVLGGMDKAVAVGSKLYPNTKLALRDSSIDVIGPLFAFEIEREGRETTDSGGKIHRTHLSGGYWEKMRKEAPENYLPFERAHREVSDCARFGFAQLDLLYDGFRNYALGYNGPEQKFTYTRLLRQAIRWHETMKSKEEEKKPLLIPVPRQEYSRLDADLFSTIGIIDTKNMVYYKNRELGNDLFPNSISEINPECVRRFKKIIFDTYENQADLIFVQGENIRKIVFGNIREVERSTK